MKCFMIEYEIDDGARFYRDTAIVYAVDEPEAKIKLQYFVGCQNSETCCSEIFSVKEVQFDIFTGAFGCRMLKVNNNTGCIYNNGHQDWDFMK